MSATADVFPTSRSTSFTRIKRTVSRPQFRFGLIVLVPLIAWYLVFFFRPVVLGFWMAFSDYDLFNPGLDPFIGFRNFELTFQNSRFWSALQNTLLYSIAFYCLTMPAALLISWCIASVKRARRFYEFVVFLPVVVSMVAIGLLFRLLMNPDIGVFNALLESVGLPTSQWVFGTDTALFSVVLVDTWKGLGFYVVIFSTAMLSVSDDLIDAAKVDGSNSWQIFRDVIMPSIANTVALVSALVAITALQVYVSVEVLGPGPGTSTLVLNQFVVQQAFESWLFGPAAAASMILFVIILAITVVQLRLLQPRADG